MKPNDISIEVFENELIPYADRYFKKVIINSQNTYFKEIIKRQKYGIEFVAFSECNDDDLRVDEKGYEMAVSPTLETKEFRITLETPALLTAFCQLTHLQQKVLIYNVILKIPLREIADKFNVSQRMIEKHKANALKKLKRSVCDNAKE